MKLVENGGITRIYSLRGIFRGYLFSLQNGIEYWGRKYGEELWQELGKMVGNGLTFVNEPTKEENFVKISRSRF